MPFDTGETRTLTERAAESLRRWIISGTLHAGQPLRQVELAGKLGLSRVPLREALRLLEGEGFVQIHPHKGAVVASLTADEFAEIAEICRVLEMELLRLAFPKLTPRLLDECGAIVERLDPVADVLTWMNLNWEFHSTLYSAASRPRMLRVLETSRRAGAPYSYIMLGKPAAREQLNADHRAVIAACRENDRERALRVLDEHLTHAIESVRRGIEGGLHDAAP